MKKQITILAILMVGMLNMHGQKSDTCKVLMNEISGVYKGGCYNGLANGKGVAKGKDTYNGNFKDGLPDGKGKYVYENGNVFNGNWRNGQKNGPGSFVYILNGKEYSQKGFWKDGDYVGTSDPEEFYRVTNQSGIDNFSIKKLEDDAVQIKISFVGSMTRYIPTDLRVASTSGQVVQENKNFVIYNYSNPNNISIHYIIKTAGGDRICNLTFEVLKLGKYEVVITNN